MDPILKELIRYFLRRIKRDAIAKEAASLSFTSILALVPALTVVLLVFAIIPSFEGVRESLKNFATTNFMPVFSEAVNDYVGTLVDHAGKLTATSTIFLFLISLFLVRSVDSSLNRIWRGGKRKFGSIVAIYWTLLTLGPISVGTIIYLTSKVLAYASLNGPSLGLPLVVAYFIFPIIIEFAVITALFIIVPSVNVKCQDAVLGAVLVTVSLEISKKVFSVFVLNFSTYEAIYGAFAVLPVLMIWIYINWWIVLLGAEFTATLGSIRGGTSENIPDLMVYLANVTGSTLGSDSLIKPKRKPLINIKVSKKL